MTFTAPPVLADAVIAYPGVGGIPNIYDIVQAETFLLRHRLSWDEVPVSGYYIVRLYWDYYDLANNAVGDNGRHFTLVSATAYFDNDGDNLPDPGVAMIDNTVITVDNGTRYAIDVLNAAGNENDGTFNVDIVLRAVGPDGTPHAVADNHPIEYSDVQSLESLPGSKALPAVTVRVLPWAGTAVFNLVDLYTVNVEKNLHLENGSKLVVKFYKYDNVTFEGENVIESFVPPAHVEENENARHPGATGVKIARLVLTTDNTDNVISTIATFTVTRDDLFGRVMEIKGLWPIASPEERDALFQEIMDTKGQWPITPS